jgi:SlyX protein
LSQEAPEERIDELESRLAFQDDTIASLDRALADQQRQISQLEKSLAEVLTRIREEDLNLDFPDEDTRPPHY